MFILISIGGWHNSHQDDPSFHTTPAFSAVAATQSAREAFVSGCINLFIKPGYPGLGRLFDGVVKGFLQTGLLSQRRVLGVNTYGKTYAGVPKINNGLYQTYTGAGPGSYGTAGEITYSDVVSWFLEIRAPASISLPNPHGLLGTFEHPTMLRFSHSFQHCDG